MQQDPNLQGQFLQGQQQGNPYAAYQPGPQQGGYQQPNPYSQNPQGYNPNPYNPQGYPQGNPQAYPPQGYPQAYGQAQVMVGAEQIAVMNTQNSVHNIETRIISGFCCYTCLCYFQLIVSLFDLIFGTIVQIGLGLGGYAVLSILGGLSMFIACILALIAKSNFDKTKQFWAFCLFIIATLISLVSTILLVVNIENMKACFDDDNYYCYYDSYGNYTCNYNYTNDACLNEDIDDVVLASQAIAAICAIPITLLISLILICNAHTLVNLMKERDALLEDARQKNNNMGPTGAAVIITA